MSTALQRMLRRKTAMEAAQATIINDFPQAALAANDNQTDILRDAMTRTLQFATIPQVRDIVQQEILDFSSLRHIKLDNNGIVTTLEDTPRHKLFPEILQAVNANLPVALIGPAGSGKSTVCEQVAKALGFEFYLQNSVTGTHELAGYMDAHGRYNTTSFRVAFENGGLILIDEVDTGDPSATKWVNTALANGYAMFPDKADRVHRHANFRAIVAANTYGTGADRVYVGANQMDASTLDRFVFFNFDYDETLEKLLAGDAAWTDRVQSLRKAAATEKARIVISPRASIHGARLLNLGWDHKVVEERVIWKGIDPDLRTRIEKHATGYKILSMVDTKYNKYGGFNKMSKRK